MSDINLCTDVAAKLMKESFRVCKNAPLTERLRWYAGGGDSCAENEDATKKSRNRALKGIWLFSQAK